MRDEIHWNGSQLTATLIFVLNGYGGLFDGSGASGDNIGNAGQNDQYIFSVDSSDFGSLTVIGTVSFLGVLAGFFARRPFEDDVPLRIVNGHLNHRLDV